MMESREPLPYAVAPSAIMLRRKGHRTVLTGLAVLVLCLGIVPFGGFALFGPTDFLAFLTAVTAYVGLPLGLFLLLAGLATPAAPDDPAWVKALDRYRTLPLMTLDTGAWPKLFPKLGDAELGVAAHLPDHDEAARAAAAAELAARGAATAAEIPLIPNFVPPHARERTAGLVITGSEPVRRWTAPALYIGIVVLLLSAVANAIVTDNGRRPNEDAELALLVIGSVATLIAAPSAALLFLLTILRRSPARLLFLRKFNSKQLSRSYLRLTRRELKPFGHVIGLSDRYMRDSWVRWFFRSGFALGRFDPFLYLYKIFILFPAVVVLRLFDRVRFGPPKVDKASNYRRLCAHLAQRKWINLRASYSTNGLFVRTTDEWWQLTALTLLLSSDLVILDLSEPTEGVEWEIATIGEFDLWHRVVVICLQEKRAAAAARPDSARLGQIWCYGRNGRFADRAGFRAAAFAAIHAAVERRWALRSEAEAVAPAPASEPLPLAPQPA